MKRRVRSEPGKVSAELTQQQAEHLCGLAKVLAASNVEINFGKGMKVEIHFLGRDHPDKGETFRLIAERSIRNESHAKYQLMYGKSTILYRLEYAASPHINPDYQTIPCPHLHYYREGYADGWAKVIDQEFGDPRDLLACFKGFLAYCNIVQSPPIHLVGSLL